MTRWMNRARPLALVLVIAGAAACAGDHDEGASADTAEINAKEANDKQFGFKKHVVVAERATAASALGIATWDVFAGHDPKTGVRGCVFYASDAAGDVKYAFSIDIATKQVALVVLNKDGTPVAGGAMDEATYGKLIADVTVLKERVEREAAAQRFEDCAAAVALGALTLVVGAGVAYLALPVMAFGGMGAMVVSGTLGTAVGAVSGTVGVGLGLVSLLTSVAGIAAGYAYGAYVAVSSVVAPAIDRANACFSPSP